MQTASMARRVLAKYLKCARWNDGLTVPQMKEKLKLLARAAKVSGDKKAFNRAEYLSCLKAFYFLRDDEHKEIDGIFEKYRHLIEHPQEIDELEKSGGGAAQRKEWESKVRKRVKQNLAIWKEWEYTGLRHTGWESFKERDRYEDYKGTMESKLDTQDFHAVVTEYSAPVSEARWELYKNGHLIEKGRTRYGEIQAQQTVQAWIEALRGDI